MNQPTNQRNLAKLEKLRKPKTGFLSQASFGMTIVAIITMIMCIMFGLVAFDLLSGIEYSLGVVLAFIGYALVILFGILGIIFGATGRSAAIYYNLKLRRMKVDHTLNQSITAFDKAKIFNTPPASTTVPLVTILISAGAIIIATLNIVLMFTVGNLI